MAASRRRCEVKGCKQKGVVILPDDLLVCYTHYNEYVSERVTQGLPVDVRIARGAR